MAQSTYDKISSIGNLYGGIDKSYSHKSLRQRSKKEVREVMENLDATCLSTHQSILDGTYSPKPYRHTDIVERGKTRHLSVLHFIDRGVQNGMKAAIEPVLINHLTSDQYAGIPHRGIMAKNRRYSTILRMKRAMSNPNYTWLFLLDIHHCYEEINNVVVMKLLERCISDRRTLALIRKHVFNLSSLAIGDPISHMICNLVMSEIVRALKENGHAKCVINYADNIAIFGTSKEEVVSLAKLAKKKAAQLRLKFNKSYPQPITERTEVVFCGRKYTRHKVLLRQSTKMKYIHARHRKLAMASYNGILNSCNCKHLRKKVELYDNKIMNKQRTPFAGKMVKADQIVGVLHTIVRAEKKASKQKDCEQYYDVQAIAKGFGLIRYTTSAKFLVNTLSSEEIPIRDVEICKDYRGLYYKGTVYTEEEEEVLLKAQYGINY